MISGFDQIIDNLRQLPEKTLAVAWGHFEDVLESLKLAEDEGIATAIIFGDKSAGEQIARSLGLDMKKNTFVDASSEEEAVNLAVKAVREGDADVLMKGLCSTSTLLRGVLNRDHGLRGNGLLSHLGIFQVPAYHKLVFLTDPAMNIAPNLLEKADIIKNAVTAVQRMGIEKPKVAAIAAVEKVNPGKMPATEDAALLRVMNDRGQIKGCIIDGPLALDLAFSRDACRIKGIDSPVSGDTDIALLPNIESGNVFYKTLSLFANARLAGIVLGAGAPIVLTSRADSDDTKFLSIAMALKVS
jgi:phosphate butyryltransferase